jgi:protein-S-isoprenylcysteine O-methyltransferase Ste14
MSGLRATRFEFEQRFWIIGGIFWVGFSLAMLDPTNMAVAIVARLFPSIDQDAPRVLTLVRVVVGCGALLVFVAAFVRTWATAYLRTVVVHDMRQHSEALVADGPFRHVRNPLYLANMPLVAGVGLMASPLGWTFMIAAMWLFMYRLIFREERGLLASQGESYRCYVKKVPRFIPAVTPRVPSGRTAALGQAFAGEIFVWLMGAGVLCFAVTLRFALTAAVFSTSLALYFVAVYLVKRNAARTGPAN